MCDIFLQKDAASLLQNKFVVIIGSSVQRSIYKDLVLLLQKDKYLTDQQLRMKGEMSFEGDTLLEGGRKGEMTNKVSYREVRQYKTDYVVVRFYFVTRAYNAYMESIIKDMQQEPQPDIIIINSCLWDITRYSTTAVDDYKKNLEKLMSKFNESIPSNTLLLWNTTLPISKEAKGGVLVPEVEYMISALSLDILEANYYAKDIVIQHGYDVVDLHYFFRYQLHRRNEDGVHWDMTAHRRFTNLFLTHIAQAWGKPLPGNVGSSLAAILGGKPATMGNANQNVHKTQGKKKKKKALLNVPQVDLYDVQVQNQMQQALKNVADDFVILQNNLAQPGEMFQFRSELAAGSGNVMFDQNGNWFEDINQSANIDRYGGPIRRPAYAAAPTFLMTWQPYEDRAFVGHARPLVPGLSREHHPYAARGRGRGFMGSSGGYF